MVMGCGVRVPWHVVTWLWSKSPADYVDERRSQQPLIQWEWPTSSGWEKNGVRVWGNTPISKIEY